MQIARQHVIDILRKAELPEVAEEAGQLLPDPVEYDDAASFLASYGSTKDELISRVGGSPLRADPRRADPWRPGKLGRASWSTFAA